MTLFPMINALTIDVEDYYMVSAFADIVRFEEWGTYESRVEKNTYRILDALNGKNVKATRPEWQGREGRRSRRV